MINYKITTPLSLYYLPLTLENLKLLTYKHHKNYKSRPREAPLGRKRKKREKLPTARKHKNKPYIFTGIAIWVYTYIVTWIIFFPPDDLLEMRTLMYLSRSASRVLGQTALVYSAGVNCHRKGTRYK